MRRWEEHHRMWTTTRGPRLPQLFAPIGDHVAPPTHSARDSGHSPGDRTCGVGCASRSEEPRPIFAGTTVADMLPGPLTAPYPGNISGNKR
jgi:hypothetical protein